ncbi:YhcN/YlaJ family sporulation lipoprotein [Paenibacillus agri]|uniref:YhcN/YlaJ family sporulation lipoprotein n=1 Tax=Paenibacillus agri TaxID=2744309 RepID=A0A850EGS3_9BACL|nr:YhcN/YlaJ family sporulation lipoprotein [Paenibacillus agri]NUU60335.1 YhcN/YlaJ family sporulation lipoprotein [Paenibacillus agri]
MLRSKISMSVSAALLLGMVSLTGCGANNTAGNAVHTKSVRGTHDGRLSVNSVRGGNQIRNYDKLEMSQKLADRVASLPEVRSANVLLAGRSAYVAVTLDRSTTQPNALGTGRYGTRSTTHGLGNGRTNGSTDGGMYGSSRTGHYGTRSSSTPHGLGNGRTNGSTDGGMYGSSGTGLGGSAYSPGLGAKGTYNPGHGTTGTGNGALGTGRNMAGVGGTGAGVGVGVNTNRGYGMQSTGTGSYNDRGITGLGTTNTTTPARNTKLEEDNVTQAIKDKIAAEIKKTSPNIDAVYVSANPDFVERFNVYAEEARAGHPLKGFADEFRKMVERIFPTRSY